MTEMIEVVGQRLKSLKRPHSRLEHALRTRVSGAIQVGLSGNLRECNNSSSIEIVSHRKVVELQYTHTQKHVADYNLRYTVGTVR